MLAKITDACRHYRVSRKTVLSWIKAGIVSAVDVAPAGAKRKHYRIDLRTVRRPESDVRVQKRYF